MRMQVKNAAVNVSRAIVRESFSVSQKIAYIREILKTEDKFTLSQLFEPTANKNEIVTTFLAMLELLKLQIITATQVDLFEDIVIQKRPDSDEIEVVVEDDYESFE